MRRSFHVLSVCLLLISNLYVVVYNFLKGGDIVKRWPRQIYYVFVNSDTCSFVV